jgi:hypothetical protein
LWLIVIFLFKIGGISERGWRLLSRVSAGGRREEGGRWREEGREERGGRARKNPHVILSAREVRGRDVREDIHRWK